jgi:drug/metabolite transporter (DMT)-like permease
VSPFNYGQLIGATLLSVVVFGQLPDVWVWAGAQGNELGLTALNGQRRV